MKSWETIQTSVDGATVAWRGDWQGEAMKGVVSFNPTGQATRDFSFFSVQWSYEKGRRGQAIPTSGGELL